MVRSKKNPILKPNLDHHWENLKVFNPTALYEGGKFHLFYRARGKDWVSRIGYAVSKDGENFERFDQPLLEPTPGNDLEKMGLEDPRIVKIDDLYLMTFAIYDGVTARQALATSKDLTTWQKHGFILKDWDAEKAGDTNFLRKKYISKKEGLSADYSKSGAMFPEKISGKFYMLFGESKIWLASSNDGVGWQANFEPVITPNSKSYFESDWVEMGPSPIKTELGWLVVYHGISRRREYSLGFVILAAGDPTKILFRNPEPIFRPQEPYEVSGIADVLPGGYKAVIKMDQQQLKNFLKNAQKSGVMPRVVFCCGAVVIGGLLRIYYGAGDTVIGTACAEIDDVLKKVND